MGNKLHIGNLPFSINSDRLADLFTKYESVESVNVITDHNSGRSKGFAFIEMSSDEEARDCLDSMSDLEIEGRQVKVSKAKSQENQNRSVRSRERY